MNIPNEILFFASFLIFIGIVLALDLGVFNRKSHTISFKEAGIWSGIWVVFALGFYLFLGRYGHLMHAIDTPEKLKIIVSSYNENLILPYHLGFDAALKVYLDNLSLEFITGYLIEYALSVDNIFVIIMIFSAFNVREKYYKKVLVWGILGAIIMRFVFIFAGAAILANFSFVVYIFGGFLVFAGIKAFLDRNDTQEMDSSKHPIVRIVSKFVAVYPRYVGNRFFVRYKAKIMVTPLFLVLLIIEFTDLIFAIDSVPAVFSITQDPYIVFFSNIFAILGLRSMFFFLVNVLHIFHYLKTGLAFLLIFIGGKMLAHIPLKNIGFETQHSLYIIVSILAISVILSLVFPKKTT